MRKIQRKATFANLVSTDHRFSLLNKSPEDKKIDSLEAYEASVPDDDFILEALGLSSNEVNGSQIIPENSLFIGSFKSMYPDQPFEDNLNIEFVNINNGNDSVIFNSDTENPYTICESSKSFDGIKKVFLDSKPSKSNDTVYFHNENLKYSLEQECVVSMETERIEHCPSDSKIDENPDAYPYTKNLLVVLDAMKFPNEEFDDLIKVITQRYPESSQIDLAPDGSILTASFSQLIIALTTPESTNLDFQYNFMVTFPSFARPYQVLASLFARFFSNIKYPRCNINDKLHFQTVRTRIIRIISKWLTSTQYQFSNEMINSIKAFLNVIDKDKTLRLQKQIIVRALRSFNGSYILTKIQSQTSTPEMILPNVDPSQWTITMIPPEELARQLALLHSSIYRLIKPTEILSELWGKNKSGGSPNFSKLIQHFNSFSNYVTLSILLPNDVQSRAAIHSFWIDVAMYTYQLKNFNGLFCIMFGLTHSSIERLFETVKISLRSNTKRKNQFFEMREICMLINNYANYRKLLNNSSGPCIPFIGCFQKDLIYVQESYPNKVNGLINFKKCTECVKLINKISSHQNERYNFEVNPDIQELITNIPLETDNLALMKLSLKREPKRKKKTI